MSERNLKNLFRSSFVRTPLHLSTRIYSCILSFAMLSSRDGAGWTRIVVLDPGVGEGDLLLPLLGLPEKGRISCTGIEINAERAAVARKRLAQLSPAIRTGALEDAHLSAGSLSLVVSSPPSYLVHERRDAQIGLAKTTEALVEGGVLVEILLAYAVWDRKLVTFWASWFDDIRIWKFPTLAEGERECPFEAYTQMVVVGRKRVEPRNLDELHVQALLAYRWQKGANGESGWACKVAPPTLPTSPIADPYLIPTVIDVPRLRT